MPRTVITILICVSVLNSGCRSLFKLKEPQPLPPVFTKEEIDLSNVIASINRNTDNVRQIESDVRISMNGLPSAISGTMLLESPSRLRLQAGLLGITDLGVDIGSNDELFWIWNKTNLPGKPASILYAQHDQFAQSAAGQQMRLQPKWIIQAFGLITFDSTDTHEGPFAGPNNLLKIRSQVLSDGQPMTRDVLIHPKYGWIERIALYDPSGRLVAYADAKNHRYDEKQQATLPQYIELFVFPESGEKLELTIQVKRLKINQLYVDPDKTWLMPQPSDVPLIDLARVSHNPSMPQDTRYSVHASANSTLR